MLFRLDCFWFQRFSRNAVSRHHNVETSRRCTRQVDMLLRQRKPCHKVYPRERGPFELVDSLASHYTGLSVLSDKPLPGLNG